MSAVFSKRSISGAVAPPRLVGTNGGVRQRSKRTAIRGNLCETDDVLLARFVFGLLLLCVASTALSCSCGVRPTVADVLSRHVVFDGTVISSRPFIDRSHEDWYVLEEWTFQVQRAWTPVAPLVTVRAYPDNCGVWFHVGERKIVVAVARNTKGVLGAFKCAYPRVQLHVANAETVLGSPSSRLAAPDHKNRVAALRNATARSVLHAVADARNWVHRSGMRRRGYEAVAGWGAVACALTVGLFVLLARAKSRSRATRKRAG